MKSEKNTKRHGLGAAACHAKIQKPSQALFETNEVLAEKAEKVTLDQARKQVKQHLLEAKGQFL
ncbi:hypothetical protein OAI07_01245 [Akkermansiaceae bacterium]|nr:hypothetical protein [Akkermansiaceae bacterium]